MYVTRQLPPVRDLCTGSVQMAAGAKRKTAEPPANGSLPGRHLGGGPTLLRPLGFLPGDEPPDGLDPLPWEFGTSDKRLCRRSRPGRSAAWRRPSSGRRPGFDCLHDLVVDLRDPFVGDLEGGRPLLAAQQGEFVLPLWATSAFDSSTATVTMPTRRGRQRAVTSIANSSHVVKSTVQA
jgi:hypothetical protein